MNWRRKGNTQNHTCVDEVVDPEEMCKSETCTDPEEATRRIGHILEREDSRSWKESSENLRMLQL